MKKFIYMPVLLFMTALTMVSCDGLLDVNSDQYTFDEQYRMKSEPDSLYAFIGILSKVQMLGDRYVLLGELRGDLMETGTNASRFLKQINEFNVTKDNPYASTKEYYDIINNCNYVIQYVDTAAKIKNDRINLKVMAMAKAARAWTYLQLVLNYGTAKYIENPIMSKDDAGKNYTTVDLSALCDKLIKDLRPFYLLEKSGSYTPYNIGQFGDYNSKFGLFSIRFILGDLYLWKGSVLEGNNDIPSAKVNYQMAASMYYDLMYNDSRLLSSANSGAWEFSGTTPVRITSNTWSNVYKIGLTEAITALASSPDYGHQFTLDSLSFHRIIAPTKNSIENWDNQLFYYSRNVYTDGDLRKAGSVSKSFTTTESNTKSDFKDYIITKFLNTSSTKQKVIILYRNSLLYLRYAEAVNRLGCSNLSFATLKTGLNSSVDRSDVIQNEINAKLGSVPSYMMFSSTRFNDTKDVNVGVHARGCGLNYSNTTDASIIDTIRYRIPFGVVDSAAIVYVEDKIVDELALETAYEGNRFHDLMRIAIRRHDPAYLADRVSVKYANKAAIRSKLMLPANWYLPK